MSEGQPALTPDQENELRLYAMRPEGHGLRVSRAAVAGALAELAREREARERDDADAWRVIDAERGRVRELREALERKARKYHLEVHGWRFSKFEYCDRPECVETREALVGLPERQA